MGRTGRVPPFPARSRSRSRRFGSWFGSCVDQPIMSRPARLALEVLQGGGHQAQRRRAEAQQGVVEAGVGVAGPPAGPGLVAEAQDLQLAPGVAAVGGVEGGPGGLGPGGRAEAEASASKRAAPSATVMVPA